MQFLRAIGIAAFTFAISMPAAQAALVTLEFDIMPTVMGTGVGSHGVIHLTSSEPLTEAMPFSMSVQLDTDALYNGGTATSPSMSFVASSYMSLEALIGRPAYTDAFNKVVPYDAGVSGAMFELSRGVDPSTPAVPRDSLAITAIAAHTIRGNATDQIENKRVLRLSMLGQPTGDPLAYTELTPYMGDDALRWVQTLQGSTGSFRDELTLVQRRFIPGGPGGSWVVDNSNAGLLNIQTITVSGDFTLRAVTVAVPEPSTAVLAILGLAGLVLARRRQTTA